MFLSVLPRLVMEPIGIISIAVVGFSIAQYDSLSNALPTLGALVLGSQRLLPIVQTIYEG